MCWLVVLSPGRGRLTPTPRPVSRSSPVPVSTVIGEQLRQPLVDVGRRLVKPPEHGLDPRLLHNICFSVMICSPVRGHMLVAIAFATVVGRDDPTPKADGRGAIPPARGLLNIPASWSSSFSVMAMVSVSSLEWQERHTRPAWRRPGLEPGHEPIARRLPGRSWHLRALCGTVLRVPLPCATPSTGLWCVSPSGLCRLPRRDGWLSRLTHPLVGGSGVRWVGCVRVSRG